MPRLILLRHGQSLWNAENRFTGWTDVDLSPLGIQEARIAGELLRRAETRIDLAYTSWLKRAIRTLWIVLDEIDRMWIPQKSAWRLNERHYGQLQGMDKGEAARKLGARELKAIRRGYRKAPPAVAHDDPRFPGADPRYAYLPPDSLPSGESLEETKYRVLAYWRGEIAPRLRIGANILVVAHGNSLRALVMELEKLDEQEVVDLEIATGIPLVYELGSDLSVSSRDVMLASSQSPTPPATVPIPLA